MTLQEIIREEVARTFYENSDISKTISWVDLPKDTKDSFFYKADSLLYRLHSQGVVIRTENKWGQLCRHCGHVCGFDATEPLIEG